MFVLISNPNIFFKKNCSIALPNLIFCSNTRNKSIPRKKMKIHIGPINEQNLVHTARFNLFTKILRDSVVNNGCKEISFWKKI
ncbi:hypothetical protein BpHYR1_026716 [Brachionus plicatilis]|uniref:Uncharacterized protein n=1 Tax=Brachionus plicatilis TaxID=10195 RepID=A0A3M7SI85_BRAPC|nr:hypothetical protein BpHYR1_026716 [Brachionus plicatilis]